MMSFKLLHVEQHIIESSSVDCCCDNFCHCRLIVGITLVVAIVIVVASIVTGVITVVVVPSLPATNAALLLFDYCACCLQCSAQMGFHATAAVPGSMVPMHTIYACNLKKKLAIDMKNQNQICAAIIFRSR
jgi:hypothetical protein